MAVRKPVLEAEFQPLESARPEDDAPHDDEGRAHGSRQEEAADPHDEEKHAHFRRHRPDCRQIIDGVGIGIGFVAVHGRLLDRVTIGIIS